MADEPNSNEGADPSDDIKKQNPGQTTTSDLASKVDDDSSTKVQDLVKAGRKDFDPNASQE